MMHQRFGERTDRQTAGQRSDSIGRTVLETVGRPKVWWTTSRSERGSVWEWVTPPRHRLGRGNEIVANKPPATLESVYREAAYLTR